MVGFGSRGMTGLPERMSLMPGRLNNGLKTNWKSDYNAL